MVVVDSCANLLGGRTGLKLPNPVVKAELCGIEQGTEPVVGSVNPVFSHRMSFLVRDPASDTLRLTVADSKRDEVLGTARFHLSDLLSKSSLSVSNCKLVLNSRVGRGDRSPVVTVSLLFRYIHRPWTSSYGVHKSLQDLSKIMAASVRTMPMVNGLVVGPPKPTLAAPGDGINQSHLNLNGDTSLKYIDDATSHSSEDEDNLNNNSISTPSVKVSSPAKPPVSPLKSPTSPTSGTNSLKLPPLMLREPSTALTRSVSATNNPSRVTDSRPKILLTLKYTSRTMTLSVVVHKLRNLQETFHTAIPCPYVKIYAIESIGISSNRRVNNSKRKTKTKRNSVNPTFEETLEYYLHPDDFRFQRLEVVVCSARGVLGRNSELGRCLVSLYPVHEALTKSEMGSGPVSLTDWYFLRSNPNPLGESNSNLNANGTNGTSSVMSTPTASRSWHGGMNKTPSSATLPRRNGNHS